MPRRFFNRGVNPDEPAAIRNKYKIQIYNELNEYLLPTINSKGVNRAYVVGVYSNQLYRVRAQDIKLFEARLLPQHLKRTPILKYAEIVHKISRILEESDQRPLGFAEGVIPEETWLMRIARYIDQQNVSGIFLEPVPNALNNNNIMSQRMKTAKENVQNFIFIQANGRNLLENSQIYGDLRKVWETQKRLNGRIQERIDTERLLGVANAKIQEETVKLEDCLLKAGMTVFAIGNGLNQANGLLDQNSVEHRNQVQEIIQLLRFIYVADPVLNREEWVINLCNRYFNANVGIGQNSPERNGDEIYEGE